MTDAHAPQPAAAPEPDASALASWAALLAHWTRFAQSALALPRDGEGGRWRASVPDVIALHALALSLARLDDLPPGERELGLDRASVQVRAHAANIHALWRAEPLPTGLAELLNEVFEALRRAPESGLEWTAGAAGAVGIAPEPEVASALAAAIASERLVLFALRVGEHAGPGSPVLFARGPRGGPPAPGTRASLERWAARLGATDPPRRVPIMRQVYRTAEGDVIAPLDDSLPAGRPLLAPGP